MDAGSERCWFSFLVDLIFRVPSRRVQFLRQEDGHASYILHRNFDYIYHVCFFNILRRMGFEHCTFRLPESRKNQVNNYYPYPQILFSVYRTMNKDSSKIQTFIPTTLLVVVLSYFVPGTSAFDLPRTLTYSRLIIQYLVFLSQESDHRICTYLCCACMGMVNCHDHGGQWVCSAPDNQQFFLVCCGTAAL